MCCLVGLGCVVQGAERRVHMYLKASVLIFAARRLFGVHHRVDFEKSLCMQQQLLLSLLLSGHSVSAGCYCL